MAWFLSYTGERSVSNMVIIDVKMLSGFIPVKSSVRKVGAHVNRLSEDICPFHFITGTTFSFSFIFKTSCKCLWLTRGL